MASNTDQTYVDLITSEYADKVNFISLVRQFAEAYVRIQSLLLSMVPVFDLDTAIGHQLDVIGQWAGVSRNIAVPITGVYFTWNAVYTRGWDYGVWQPSNAPADITVLPDDSYRVLVKAKIAANNWDGTTDGAYAIWDALFTQFTILIQDHYNMSYDLAIVGGIVDSLTLALIRGGYIPLRPEGVRVNKYLVPVDSGPAFAWDVESTLLKGWNEGSWLRELNPT